CRQDRLGGKAGFLRHMRGLHADGIIRPSFRQIQRPIDKGMAMTRHITSKGANLAVGDLPRRPGILPGNPAGAPCLASEIQSHRSPALHRRRPAFPVHNCARHRADHRHSDGGCEKTKPWVSRGDGWAPSSADEDWGRGKRPAINMSWAEARAYVKWLSHKT